MLIALVLAQALSIGNPRGPIFNQPSLMGSFAGFEAFPANGRGTGGAPCLTTAPTGARGEALTFTRGSNGTCTKTVGGGLATTGIATGDLVVLSTNVARVEFDGAGSLGLLTESARTNTTLRSQEIDDAVWTKRTANAIWVNDAGAPDGTTTADALHLIPTVATLDVDGIYQISGCPVGAVTASVYLRGAVPMDGGVAQSGSIDITIDKGGTFQCGTCAYSASSWNRCSLSATTVSSPALLLGNDSRTSTCSSGNHPVADVLIWGAQCELGAYATSYIPTTSATATRSADAAYFALSFATAAGFSTAHTFALESTTNFTGATGLLADATNRTQLYQSGTNSLTADYFSTAGNRSATSVPGAWVVGTPYRVALAYSGAGASSTVASYLAGVLQNTSATGLTGSWTSTQFGIGLNSPWGSADAIVSRLCLDPSQSRCR